jgi:hypothetical protein
LVSDGLFEISKVVLQNNNKFNVRLIEITTYFGLEEIL